MIKNITPDAARDTLYALEVSPRTETIAIGDALGRVAAENVFAGIHIPPFDCSLFDGYAFRSADTVTAARESPVKLKITEELPAGVSPTINITPGFAAKILTGAPIPPGADCTVKYEQTEYTASEVSVFAPAFPGSGIVYAGKDVKQGDCISRCGSVITPTMMGLFASIGLTEAEVYAPPRAAIINTGTELVEPGNPLQPAKIYNSNAFTLSGYLRGLGIDAYNAGRVDDDIDAIAQRISAALEDSDIVVTTGGASVGDYDCAIRVFEKLGAEVLFWKTQIKPGGAAAAALLNGKLVLALSGNPGGAVAFLLRCCVPYIKKLCGYRDCFPEPIEVFLKTPVEKLSGHSRVLRGRLEIDGGRAYFAEYGDQGGGETSSFTSAEIIAEIPADSAPLPAGTLVKAWRL